MKKTAGGEAVIVKRESKEKEIRKGKSGNLALEAVVKKEKSGNLALERRGVEKKVAMKRKSLLAMSIRRIGGK